jgi:hypothetical protein
MGHEWESTYQSCTQTEQLLRQLLYLEDIALLASKTLVVLRHVFIARHQFLSKSTQVQPRDDQNYLDQLLFLMIVLEDVIDTSPHVGGLAGHVASLTTVGTIAVAVAVAVAGRVLHGLDRSAHGRADGHYRRWTIGEVRCGRHGKERWWRDWAWWVCVAGRRNC